MRASSSPTNLRTKIEDLNRGRTDHQRLQWLVKRLSGQSFVTSVRSFRHVFFFFSILAFYQKMLFTYANLSLFCALDRVEKKNKRTKFGENLMRLLMSIFFYLETGS